MRIQPSARRSGRWKVVWAILLLALGGASLILWVASIWFRVSVSSPLFRFSLIAIASEVDVVALFNPYSVDSPSVQVEAKRHHHGDALRFILPGVAYTNPSHRLDLGVAEFVYRPHGGGVQVDARISLWTMAIPPMAIGLYLLRAARRGDGSARIGKCSTCGYNREGLGPQSNCPECGSPAPSPKG